MDEKEEVVLYVDDSPLSERAREMMDAEGIEYEQRHGGDYVPGVEVGRSYLGGFDGVRQYVGMIRAEKAQSNGPEPENND